MNELGEHSKKQKNGHGSMRYRRLRAPQNHGETLQFPPLKEVSDTFAHNLASISNYRNHHLADSTWSKLIDSGRSELVDLACRYTQRYFDVASILPSGVRHDQIVMAGHQPRLFHPGVWYKNFVLSQLGSSLQAVAINLVVDNDICGNNSIHLPEVINGVASYRSLPFDSSGDNIPFELRQIEDEETFRAFPNRVTEAISDIVPHPLVNQLWEHTLRLLTPNRNLGQTISTGRHALELSSGLKTLEIPLSQIAGTISFAQFCHHLVEHASEFAGVYNRSLKEYRALHRIRSRSHPVPELRQETDLVELPLWIWQNHQPARRRLFVRSVSHGYELVDRGGFKTFLENRNFVEQFSELNSHGIAVRPRALLTTMYCRLILSDLFLHGIGGAKYDQLTDAIIESFFGFRPAKFATLTATMKLPSGVEEIRPSDISSTKQRLRELDFHPEFYADNRQPRVIELGKKKNHWVNQVVPKAELRNRHQKIDSCNVELREYVQSEREIQLQKLAVLQTNLRTSQILGSREFSFCLFPSAIIEELKAMAS